MSSSLDPSARTFVPQQTSSVQQQQQQQRQTTLQSFPQLENLQEELILNILSFVSDVPYASTTDQGTTYVIISCEGFFRIVHDIIFFLTVSLSISLLFDIHYTTFDLSI